MSVIGPCEYHDSLPLCVHVYNFSILGSIWDHIVLTVRIDSFLS